MGGTMIGSKQVLLASAAVLAMSGAAHALDSKSPYDTSAIELDSEAGATTFFNDDGPKARADEWLMLFELSGGGTAADASGGSGSEESVDFDDDGYPLIEGRASVSKQLGDSNWRGQADINGFATFTDRDAGDGESFSSGSGGEDNVQTYFGASAQVNYIAPDETYSIGVLGHVGSSNGGEDENAVIALGAVQGQWNADQFSIFGQAGGFTADDESEMDVMTDAYFVRGGVSYYPNDNARVRLDLQYAQGEENDSFGADVDAFTGSLRGDMAINDGPLRVFGEFRHTKVENDSSGDEYTDNTFLVGLSVALGTGGDAPSIRRTDILMPHDVPEVGLWTASTLEIAD